MQNDYYRSNPSYYKKKAKESYEKVRDFVRELKNSTPCSDCKIQYPYFVMDFDHRENKNFTISEKLTQLSLSSIKREISKCDIVCSNCHRIRTQWRASETASRKAHNL